MMITARDVRFQAAFEQAQGVYFQAASGAH